jgi:protein-tyrosine phosphatase
MATTTSWEKFWKQGPHPPREDYGPKEAHSDYCLLVSAGEVQDEDRDQVMKYLARKGYQYLEASGTRVVYPDDGNYPKFYDLILTYAQKHKKVVVHRVVRCKDPGLGIIFPED